ncbi:glycosyltransferase family 4 protein [Candidatus Woesearchaeota archaeon]|nr:glycosyltransferase family 4 protein [Candidatus Woesearchaeota archaeon]
MKVLMTSCGGIIRGIESWPEYNLARELVKNGHDVTVISSSSAMKKHDAAKEEIIEGIKVKRFNPVSPSSLFYMLGNDFDLIHMHHLGYLAPISSYASLREKMKGTPTIFTIHGIYHDPYLVKDIEDPLSLAIKRNVQMTFPYKAPWRIKNWLAHLPLSADRITALTEWEKREVTKLGVSKDKIDVIPNSIDLAKYRPGRRNYFKKKGIHGDILLFVGQPTRRKGWEYFLGAMPEIIKKYPNTKAVFIGYRHDKALDSRCRQLGIEESVEFLGFLPEKEKIDAFQSADVFVFPTLYEGFGIVFLEAMAAGLPIVTTDTAGNSEIVRHGENGLLVKPKDGKEIAKAVVRLLGDKQLRIRVSKNNITNVKQYDSKIIAKRYMKLYEDVVK